MAGSITGVIALSFHLFWMFKTANSKRAKLKIILPSFMMKRMKRRNSYSLDKRLVANLPT